jgi:hypothetical protein
VDEIKFRVRTDRVKKCLCTMAWGIQKLEVDQRRSSQKRSLKIMINKI